VSRLVLLVLLGIVAMYYFPESRGVLMSVGEPVLLPVIRWDARQEMGQVGRNVIDHERLTGKLPDRRSWIKWLDYRYTTDDLKTDAWGQYYQLQAFADSIQIISWGPDRTRGTDDDFHVTTPRERRRRSR
jgi:hypothetical protein